MLFRSHNTVVQADESQSWHKVLYENIVHVGLLGKHKNLHTKYL